MIKTLIRIAVFIELLVVGCVSHPEVHERDHHAKTPLHKAALRGQCDEIRQLLAKGAKANSRDDGGETPLHSAAMNGHVDAIKLLVEYGARVNAKTRGKQTPLHFAARKGSLQAVKYLVEQGAKIRKQRNIPLNDAVAVMSMPAGWSEPQATTKQRLEMISFFLDHGVNVNGRGNCGFAIGDGNWAPLHAASFGAAPEVLRRLIARGAEVDALDPSGETPLFHAALGGNAAAAKVLLENGAEVNIKNNLGVTPLHRAVSMNNLGCINANTVKVLLDHNADVNSLDHRQETPLHCAIDIPMSEGPKIVKTLLDAGADIHLKDRYGRSPLSKALEGKNVEIRRLLENSADQSTTF